MNLFSGNGCILPHLMLAANASNAPVAVAESSPPISHRLLCQSPYHINNYHHSFHSSFSFPKSFISVSLIPNHFATATKSGKQSSSVLLCLFVACSVNAGALVVFKKVDLQILHWISFADSLAFSCDLAGFASFAFRSRFCCALAPLPMAAVYYDLRVG